MSVKAFNKEKDSFVKIASLQSRDIVVEKADFVSDNVSDALSELKRDLNSMKSNVAWIYNNGTIGGGGGGSDSQFTGIIEVENFDEEHNLVLQDTEAASVTFKVISKLNTPFSVTIVMGTLRKSLSVMPNVSNTVNLGQVSKDTHPIVISGEDYTGYPMETWRGYIIKGLISLSTSFKSETEFGMTKPIRIPYRVKLSTAVITRPLTVFYTLDNGDAQTVYEPKPNETQYITINPNGDQIMKMGTHKVVITALIPNASGVDQVSVSLTITFLVQDPNHIAIYIPYEATDRYVFGNTVAIPFNIIAHKMYSAFTINHEIYAGETASGTPILSGTGNFYRGTNWSITVPANTENGYAVGKYTLKLNGNVPDTAVDSIEDCIFTFELVASASTVAPWDVNRDGLVAYFNARTTTGFSGENADKWKNDILNDPYGITCTFYNHHSGLNGFQHTSVQDPQNNNLLRLFGETYGVIELNPFVEMSTKGFSVEMLYRCSNNGEYDSVVASCGEYSVSGDNVILKEGFCIDANNIQSVYSRQGTNTLSIEDEWIHCVISYEPMENDSSQMFTKIYINGTLSAAINHSYQMETVYPENLGNIYLGGRYYWVQEGGEKVDHVDKFSDVEFKTIKIYNRPLKLQEVVANYIAEDYYMHYADGTTDFDGARNSALRTVNSLDENKQFIEGEGFTKLPRVYVKFEEDNIEAFNKLTNDTSRDESIINTIIDCYLRYETASSISNNQRVVFDTYEWNSDSNNVQINKAFIKLLGTTSLTYNRKNYDISFGTWADSQKPVLFTPKYGASNDVGRKQWLPENTFTLKADLIDSSHANNVGTANAISTISESANLNDVIPPMIAGQGNENSADVKFAVDGFPCLLYVYDNAAGDYLDVNNPGTPSFYGVYMFDLGRTSYYNMGMMNMQIGQLDPAQGIVGCVATDYTNLSDSAAEGEMYSTANTFVYEGNANAAEGGSVAFLTTDMNDIQVSWGQKYPLEASATGYTKLQQAIANAYNWDLTGFDEFDAGQVWHRTTCITYLLCAYLFGMVDNLGKNMQVKSWDGTQWFPMFYDLDTVLGLNNTGQIYYGTNVDLDEYGEGQSNHHRINRIASDDAFYDLTYGAEGGLGRGKGSYNTSDSKLWNAVRSPRAWFGVTDESGNFVDNTFRYLYKTLRDNGTLTYTNLYSFYEKIIGSIGQTYYNRDAEIKYLVSYEATNEDGTVSSGYHNLTFLHGTRELLTKRWLRDRLRYLDSLFEVLTGPSTSSSLQTRNTFDQDGILVGVKTTCPVFVRRFSEASQNTITALTDKYYFTNYDIAKAGATNAQVTFNNANIITYLRGINRAQLEYVNVSNAASLIQLDLSNSQRITEIELKGLKSLRHLNVSYCPFSEDKQNSLDLSSSTSLQTVDISYSGINNILLPVGGTLKSFNASNTKITTLNITAQAMLEEIDLSNCTSLSDLVLTDCHNLKRVVLTNSALTTIAITACPNLEEVILTGNARMGQVNFSECPNIKKIDFTDCSLNTLAQYTGEESTDLLKALDLRGCTNLEEITLTGCHAQVIRFSKSMTTLKKIIASTSQWMQTIYTSSAGDEFGTLSVDGTIYPAIDLGNFTALETVSFASNAYVYAVTNMVYGGPCSELFRYCTMLKRVTGHITIPNSNDYMFANLSKSFRLNSAYASKPTADNAASLTPDLKITIPSTTTTLYHCFDRNAGVTLNDAYYFCGRIGSSVQNCQGLFMYTNLQGQESTGESVSSTLLKNATGLRNVYAMFYSAGLKGEFPSGVLNHSSLLESVAYMFSYNGFTSLNSQFGSNLFVNNPNLSDASYFLHENRSLTTTESSPVDLSKLFINNPLLTTCASFIGILPNESGGTNSAEDSIINAAARRKLYIDLSGSGKLFSKNPYLTSCAYAFCKCTCIGVMDENIFGGINSTQTTDGSTASFSNKIKSIAYCFHDSNATVELTNNLFKHLTNLENASAFVSGGLRGDTVNRCDNVTGDIATLTSLFNNNTKLTHVRRFFEATGVIGVIPTGTSNAASPLFSTNTALIDVKYLFRNCTGLTNDFPALLFGNCPNINTVKGLFRNCTGLTGSIPGSTNSPDLHLLKCLTTSDGCYTSLTDCSEIFRGCSNMYSTIPSNLFTYTQRVTTVANLFDGCGKAGDTNKGVYGTVPVELFSGMSSLSNVSYLFSGCHNISTVTEDNVKYNVPTGLFSSTKVITNAAGMFRYIKIYGIPSTLFSEQSQLSNVSYMFNNCDRSEANIPNVLFDKCPAITTIRCFAGESINAYISSVSFTTFPSTLFKEYSVTSQTGQKHISDVFCAFRNNNTATGNAILFDQWVNKPDSDKIAGCYNNCSALSNISSVPAEYKTSA